jgi:hypothetical protein
MNNNNQDLQFLALILKLDNRVKVYSNPVDLVLTEVDTFDLDLDLTVLTEYSLVM